MSATDKLGRLNLDAHVAEMMWPKFSTYMAAFRTTHERKLMPIETMPEGTMIPPISLSDNLALVVQQDIVGYYVIYDGVRRPVKVTWNGHFATSELAQPFDTGQLVPKHRALGDPKLTDEPDELVVELRRIADALETLANVTKGTTPSVVVNPGVVVNPE